MWFRVITTFVVLVLMRTSLCRGESCKGRYFTISDDKLTHSAAATSCGNYKAGKLASVPDGETQGELVKLANQRTWDPYIWLGGKRTSASSDFLWPGGIKVISSGYNKWPSGKVQGSGLCMILIGTSGTSGTSGYTWLWGDSTCTANRYYLCQYNDTRSISIDSPSYRVQLGHSVTITGKITGLYNEPLTIIAKYTSGEVIVATGVKTTTFSYTISSAVRSQFTTIRFVAKGSSCVTSEATTVLLENAPASISLSRSIIAVNYNIQQTVDCTSSGKPTPQITWYRNNAAVKTTSPGIYQGSQTGSGPVNRRLYLTLTNVVDSGSYVCKVAANVAGPLRQSTLTVRVPANIALSSTVVNLDYKQLKTVDCTSKGNPRPSVTWKRNGVAVTSAISNDIHQSITYPSSLQAKSRLSLKITNANQGGDYTCDASNTGGSRTATLTVRVSPSASLTVASIAAEYATPYQADCYSSGFPKPSITWKRFGNPVTSATNQPIYVTSIATSNPLEARTRINFIFSNVGQSGVYVCEASNVVKTTSVSLGITMPVNISVSSTKLKLDYNQTKTVDCQSFGYPRPQMFWQRNGANVTTATTSEVFQTVTHVSDSQTRSSLTFKVLSAHHSGSYTCTATNTVTTTKKTSTIIVSIAPDVQLSYAQVATNYTQQYPIDCSASGWPKPTVLWKRNGNPVPPTTGAAVYQETVSGSSSLSSTVRLHLKLDSIEQAGDYVCEANNEVLTRNKTFKVLVASNVSLTQTTVKTDYRQIRTVVCTSYGYPKPSVTWKRNGTVVSTIPSNIHQSHVVTEAYKTTQKLHLRITNVSESGNYTCEVEANVAGGMKTASVLVQVVISPVINTTGNYNEPSKSTSANSYTTDNSNSNSHTTDSNNSSTIDNSYSHTTDNNNSHTTDNSHNNARNDVIKDYVYFLIGGAIIVVVQILLVGIFIYHKRSKKAENDVNSRETQGSFTRNQEEVSIRRFEESEVKLVSRLGDGKFGIVWKAKVTFDENQATQFVAAKVLKNGDQSVSGDLQKELEEMVNLGKHRFIIEIVGIGNIKDNLYVFMELMDHGDLRSFLIKQRPGEPTGSSPYEMISIVGMKEMVRFALDIAEGMDYISSHGLVHRDLACRNVLVGRNLNCKISGFGLTINVQTSDHVYVNHDQTEARLAARWMAPEAYFDQIFTNSSDVWSLGVAMWEIVTFGGIPYEGCSGVELHQKVVQGHRLEKPQDCPEQLYEVMLQCWKLEPAQRPSFKRIVEMLEHVINNLDNPTAVYEDIKFKEAEFCAA